MPPPCGLHWYTTMTNDSRNAPKFMIRYSSTRQRDAVHAAAEAGHIAINSFVLQAIDEKLGRGRALDHLISLASITLGVQPAQVERSGTYIAGPMTGLPEYNYPAFNELAAKLRSEGERVENPAENPIPACGSWEGYMRMALAQMLTCERVALLPGWRDSRGAQFERLVAETVGMKITEVTR